MEIGKVCATAMGIVSCCAIVLAAPSGGKINGRVTYEGTPAKPKTIDMSKEPNCAKQYTDPAKTETAVMGSNNSLENVVVYISAGVPDETAPASKAPAQMEQKGCRYVPHVAVMQVGQELRILNDDPTLHNVYGLAKANPPWNRSQTQGAPPIVEKFTKAEFISVKCNVHPWMRSVVAVLATSHYALTQDGGGFTLPDLPPGKYTVTAWHESYGAQSQSVTIEKSETKTVNFVFKSKPH